jgi:transposase
MDLPDPPETRPRAVGVDDFALRRGHVYGTVVIDAETHRVLDLLPERDAATPAPWLARHPQIEVICRDRSGAYADAAHTAAPQALQVAYRFHLWQNLANAVEKTVAAHRLCLRDLPAPALRPEPEWETTEAPGPKDDEPSGKFAERARVHHALVHDLLAQGLGLREIARHLSWGRHTVQRYARAARWQDMVKGRKRQQPSKLHPFMPYLTQRWAETEGKVTILDREITARGFRGHYSTVQLWVRKDLPKRHPADVGRAVDPPGHRLAHPAPRNPRRRREDPQEDGPGPVPGAGDGRPGGRLDRRDAHHARRRPAHRLDHRRHDRRPPWRQHLRRRPGSRLRRRYRRTDHRLNSGPVEWAVNRIKMLKRQMFGRAGFQLPRKHVLLA